MRDLSLEKLLNMKTEELKRELKKSATISNKNSYIFLPHDTKNKVCLVAHIDTVLDSYDNDFTINFNIGNKKVINSMMKADDRAGVFACLEIFYNTPQKDRPIVLLCDKEEIGGIGAEEACKKYKNILKDVKYFVELDRRGINDCVFYQNEESWFKKHVESFGFKHSFGSFSDISILCRNFNLAGVNLSIGFEDEHSQYETLNIPAMYETIKKVKSMILDASIKNQVLLPVRKIKYLDKKYDNMLYSNHQKYWNSEPSFNDILDIDYSSIDDSDIYEDVPDEAITDVWNDMLEEEKRLDIWEEMVTEKPELDIKSLVKKYLQVKGH